MATQTKLSPEATKVAGSMLAQAGDIGAARRVAVEVAGWLSEIDGVPMVTAVAAPAVVVDAIGELDWQATALAAEWVTGSQYDIALAECERQKGWAEKYYAEREGMTGTIADLRAQLKALDRECNELRALAAVATAPVKASATAPVSPAPVAPVAKPVAAAAVSPALKSTHAMGNSDPVKPDSVAQDAWDRMPPAMRAFVAKRK